MPRIVRIHLAKSHVLEQWVWQSEKYERQERLKKERRKSDSALSTVTRNVPSALKPRSAEAHLRAPQVRSQADALVFAEHKLISVFLYRTPISEGKGPKLHVAVERA
jgi:hypothetical protein